MPSEATNTELDAFLLSREWRDATSGIELTLWCLDPRGAPVEVRVSGQRAVMFVPRPIPTASGEREPKTLRTREGEEVDAVYFRFQRELIAERERVRNAFGVTLESDIKPSDRYLMERFVTAGLRIRGKAEERGGIVRFRNPQVQSAHVEPPPLRRLSIDIETDGWDGPILSVALAPHGHPELDRVYIVGEPTPDEPESIVRQPDERLLLIAVFDAIRELDPDMIVGWNIVDFDLRTLGQRAAAHRIPFAVGRDGRLGRVLEGANPTQLSIARIPGRVVLDGVATLKNATWQFERYSLDFVAKSLLGRGKKIRTGVDPVAEIRRMYTDEPVALAEYNLEDARLVNDVFDAARLLEFAIERARLTGLPLDRQGGAVAAFDHLYLPRLHRRGYVAADVGSDIEPSPSPGGYVLDSVPGLYRNVLSFDFRSLYPSIIRTFRVDPLGMWVPGEDPIPGYVGASFAREGAILPEIVTQLAAARSDAIKAKNEPLSRAIKILMNSFYGVLGTPGCRFSDTKLASSITRRGHDVIERTQDFFERCGLRVIYGDTDSLFVLTDEEASESDCRALGKKLAAEVNRFWADDLRASLRLESQLELRFESHYLRFLMPTTRGTDRGSKKRYAGLVRRESGELDVVIRGLEAVRTDWAPIAREMQRELLARVFTDREWSDWLRQIRGELLEGRLDAKLVYHKRLRRELDAYESSAPHVRAARLRASRQHERGQEGADSIHEIEYVVTTKGAEPLESRSNPIDYTHYLDKQLAPAADVILALLDTSFEREAGAQLSLF